jgi:hypothetical protein
MRKKVINLVCGALVAMAFGLSGCGGGGGDGTPSTPAIPPSVDSTGTWKGTYTSSVVGSKTATLSLLQNNATLTGNYSNSAGGLGSVSGTVRGNTATFTISVTTPGCSGSFSGTGIINTTVTPATMAFTYNGAANASCGGSENGTGNLIKQ